MPRTACTVCNHADREAIDEALKKGAPPLRELARQVDLTHSALWRHKQHLGPVKGKVVKDIPAEISKLRAAQTRAKRRGDTTGVLSISREIRAWMAFEAKAESAAAISNSGEQSQVMTRAEALTTAKALIEAELAAGSEDLLAWLVGLLERASVTAVTTVPPDDEAKSCGAKQERLVSTQSASEVGE